MSLFKKGIHPIMANMNFTSKDLDAIMNCGIKFVASDVYTDGKTKKILKKPATVASSEISGSDHLVLFFCPPVQLALWSYIHHFMSVCPSVCDKNSE